MIIGCFSQPTSLDRHKVYTYTTIYSHVCNISNVFSASHDIASNGYSDWGNNAYYERLNRSNEKGKKCKLLVLARIYLIIIMLVVTMLIVLAIIFLMIIQGLSIESLFSIPLLPNMVDPC